MVTMGVFPVLLNPLKGQIIGNVSGLTVLIHEISPNRNGSSALWSVIKVLL